MLVLALDKGTYTMLYPILATIRYYSNYIY